MHRIAQKKETTMTTDPIADYLTRVRNAIMARKKVVEVPASGLKKDITRILYDKGYILSWKAEDLGPRKQRRNTHYS